MNWKVLVLAMFLVASFGFATENGTVDLKVTKVAPSPRHLYPGTEDIGLTVTLINTGTKTLTGVEAELDLPSDLERSYSGSDYYYVGTLMPEVPAILMFDINIDEDADEDELCIDLNLQSGNHEDLDEEICIDIEAKPDVTIKSKSIPLMSTGGNFPVSVTVQNKGEEEAADVKVKLVITSSLPFNVKENLQELGSLDEDEKATAAFDVFVEEGATAKDYNVEVQIRYTSGARNDENVYVTTDNVEFDVTKSQGMTGAFSILASPWFALIFGVIVIGIVALVLFGKKKK